MKIAQQSLTTPLLQGALWWIGLLSITGIGIVSFNQFSSDDVIHNAGEEIVSENDDTARVATEERAKILEEIANLQQDVSNLQAETSGLQTEIVTVQDDVTLSATTFSEQIAELESQLASLESGFSTLFPLGTYIAVNGTVDQKTMNLLGWALCDGSAIDKQVKDAVLWGNTYNLAGRTLVGEGDYAKDETISFPLGYVDLYTVSGAFQAGEVLHTLTDSEMPNHTHTIALKAVAGGGASNGLAPMNGYTADKDFQVSTKPAGGDEAHNNMSPFHVVQWYIKVK